MHDINTIKRMNAEHIIVGDRVKVRDDSDNPMNGETGVVTWDDGSSVAPLRVTFTEPGATVAGWFYRHELEKLGTPSEDRLSAQAAAQKVLDNHSILDHWSRTGEQIRELLIEAIIAERG